MNRGKFIRWSLITLGALIALWGAYYAWLHRFKGFEPLENGYYSKLNAFDDCTPPLANSDHFVMDITFHKANDPQDTGYHFLLYHGRFDQEYLPKGDSIDTIHPELIRMMQSMQCGDDISYILPFGDFDKTFLSAYADQQMYPHDELVELRMHLMKTFQGTDYARFLMQSAQQEDIDETDAIELLLMNQNEHTFIRKGKCFIEYFNKTEGDSIHVGDMVHLEYTTRLLDGTVLDTTTAIHFDFGRPGQLIGGFQYGVSLLREGEYARIYLPSAIAFGENGSSTGIIPARTPVYFDVKVISVGELSNESVDTGI